MRKSCKAKERKKRLIKECRVEGGHNWYTTDQKVGQERCRHCDSTNGK